MMLDELIKQLTKMREKHGNIEVDLGSDECFSATADKVCYRIDEFGDPILVIPDAYGKKHYDFDECIRNDKQIIERDEKIRENACKALRELCDGLNNSEFTKLADAVIEACECRDNNKLSKCLVALRKHELGAHVDTNALWKALR